MCTEIYISTDEMKLTKVIPIYESGDVMEVSNYRPVSVLSVFSNIIQKLMYKRCISFFNNFNLPYKLQFGFRENHSTNIYDIFDR